MAIDRDAERRADASRNKKRAADASTALSHIISTRSYGFLSVHSLKFGFPFFSAVVIGRFTSVPYGEPR